jgi:hypothetical protein
VEVEWIEPTHALNLATKGQRKVVLPTRLSLGTLAEAGDVNQALTAAQGRKCQPISVTLEQRPDGPYLVVDPKFGFGPISEPFVISTANPDAASDALFRLWDSADRSVVLGQRRYPSCVGTPGSRLT